MGNVPAIGIDLDGCIDEAPGFFGPFSHCWPGSVYVITFRHDFDKAKKYVDSFDIKYEEIILVNRFDEKAIVIQEKDIGVYFDDQDEILLHIPANVVVMKIRNEGNYDFETKQWLFSQVTGREI